MRSVVRVLCAVLVCALFLTALPGCPVVKFRLYLENEGSANTIVGVYLVDQNSTDPGWGPNLLNVDPLTEQPVPILPGEAVWLTHEFIAGPTYDWMVEFAQDVADRGHDLVFEPGISTSASVTEITAYAMLEEVEGGGSSYNIGYNWGGPQK
jgi:hypothetical protein